MKKVYISRDKVKNHNQEVFLITLVDQVPIRIIIIEFCQNRLLIKDHRLEINLNLKLVKKFKNKVKKTIKKHKWNSTLTHHI